MRPHQTPLATQDVLAAVRALEPRIREAADTMEAERRLPPALARALMEAGVFRMGVPGAECGAVRDPLSQVRVVEELSRIEGSVGWLSMISSAGSFLAAFLEPRVAQRLFGGVDSVVAGQIRPPQHADLVAGGYRVSGRFHFASGCQHASLMACRFTVYENGEPPMHRPHPQFRAVVGPIPQGTHVDDWD